MATDPALAEALTYPFMQRAYLAAGLIGIIAPLIGSYLVHRRMAFIGDTLAHTAFAGVGVGIFLSATAGWTGDPLTAALAVAVLASLLIQYVTDRAGEYSDVAMAIVLSGGFALGTVLVSLSGGISVSVSSYLFGNISTVTPSSVATLLVLAAAVLGTVALTHKQLLFITFDEEAARVARLNVDLYNTLLAVLTALVVVASIQILGVILVAGMLVIPVAAASHLTDSFTRSMLLGVAIGEAAALSGVTLSYLYDLATGGTIVLVAIALYAAALAARNLAT